MGLPMINLCAFQLDGRRDLRFLKCGNCRSNFWFAALICSSVISLFLGLLLTRHSTTVLSITMLEIMVYAGSMSNFSSVLWFGNILFFSFSVAYLTSFTGYTP